MATIVAHSRLAVHGGARTYGAAVGCWGGLVDIDMTLEADTAHQAIGVALDALRDAGLGVQLAEVEVMIDEAEAERRFHEPSLPDVAGSHEVAVMLAVSKQRLHQLRARPDFPTPILTLAAGPTGCGRASWPSSVLGCAVLAVPARLRPREHAEAPRSSS